MEHAYQQHHQAYDNHYEHPPPPPSMSINTQTNGYEPQLQPSADVPPAVQALLLSTKALQSSLVQWSRGQASEATVSDIYVEIGTHFNAVIRAFAACGVDLSDIHNIPTELRVVLEGCLAEDPSEQVLNIYMPLVRKVLWKLLKGLQARQDLWRRVASG